MPNFFVNGRFLAAKPTGVQRVAEELLVALSRRAERDERLAALLDGEVLHPSGTIRSLDGSVFPARQIGRLTGQLWEQLELPRAAKQTLLLNFCNVSPVLAKNSVTMIHDAQVFLTPDSYSRAFRTWYRSVLPAIGKRAKRVLTVSDYSKDQLAAFGIADRDKISVIHNGIDHVERVIADKNILSKMMVTPQSYCVGLANTQKHKNLGVVIDAFRKPDMAAQKLVLFGGATGEDFAQAGIPVPDNVIFAGFINDDQMRTLLEHALAMVFPSRTEGFGLPPLEAMFLGTPAICAPCGALPEVCGDAAIYADPDDPDAWSAAILTLADDTREMRSNRAASVKQHSGQFTWDAAAGKLIDQIERLI
ncbi:MAG: glycosyltransferase family 1 protein [Henriciella sp.]|nr:glycosyltransferase family 1 protein [Henriciella sp.]